MRKHPNLNPQRAVSSAAGKEDDVVKVVGHKPCPRTPGVKRSEEEICKRRYEKAMRRIAAGKDVAKERIVKDRMFERIWELNGGSNEAS